MLNRLLEAIESFSGERDNAPPFLARGSAMAIQCLVWIVWVLLIYAFSGQSSKFIYIDF
jgi:hypothetical protein